MIRCYSCNNEITSETKSFEHVIPNSIGGHLKSDQLLCKACNESFGNTIDKVLNDQLGYFGILLNVKRDRTPDKLFVKGQYETGEVRYIGPGLKGKYKIVIPVKIENRIEYKEIYPQTEAEFNKLKKKHEKSLIQKFGSVMKVEESEFNSNKLSFSTSENPKLIGGSDFFRAVCKIAVNFYLFKGGDKENIIELIDFIVNGNVNKYAIFYYPDVAVVKRENDEIEHHIFIKGDSENRSLIGYVELFSSHCILIMFNENYVGANFEMKYSYDLVEEVEVSREIQIPLNGELSIENLRTLTSKESSKKKHDELIRRFFEIVERKQDELKAK